MSNGALQGIMNEYNLSSNSKQRSSIRATKVEMTFIELDYGNEET